MAPTALPSGSGGGVGTFGPANMNDEDQCQFYWPAGNSATIQYRWRQAQSIDHFVIVTDRSCQAGSVCAHTNAGRGIGRVSPSSRELPHLSARENSFAYHNRIRVV